MKHKPIILRAMELPQLCDICNRRRNKGNHQKCSKLRQSMHRRAP